jgi:hypothetical protein
MAQNPLQEYYRQPRIFISLPSKGIYNKLGSISGDPLHMPIYGMTGMDDIIMKTPDALLTGESTTKLFESCCPSIKDGWEVTTLDTDLLLTAIRIATHGSVLEIVHTCSKCKTENEYDVDLGTVIDHFASCKYENTIEYGTLTIKLQPLTYRQTTDFSLRNFQLQQRLAATKDADADDQKKLISSLFIELGDIQNEIYTTSIESIDTGKILVSERDFIAEWLQNCDKTVFDLIKEKFNKNKSIWKIPEVNVVCSNKECGHKSEVSIELDQTNFFDPA